VSYLTDRTIFVLPSCLHAAQPTTSAARDAASGLPTGKRMHKPYRMTGSPTLTTQNKPINPAVNPALQGNVLGKGTVGGSTGPTKPTLPTTGPLHQ
jgi:hypothetical protein